MTVVFVAIAVCAGAGLAAATGLAAYAQRNWKTRDHAATAKT
ncbi:MAG: hypothetical protein ACRDSH_22410 [Pseudonocardiaceae bacterium]